MFDPFSPSYADLQKLAEKQAAYSLALALLLQDKGIITTEEFDKAYLQAVHLIEQEAARLRDIAAQGLGTFEKCENCGYKLVDKPLCAMIVCKDDLPKGEKE